MIDPQLIRDRLADVERGLRARGLDPTKELAELVALEAERRRLIPAVPPYDRLRFRA